MGIVDLFYLNYRNHFVVNPNVIVQSDRPCVAQKRGGWGMVLWHCCRKQIALPWRSPGRELRPLGTPSSPSPHPSSLRHICGGVRGIQLGASGTAERVSQYKQPQQPLSICWPSLSNKQVQSSSLSLLSNFGIEHNATKPELEPVDRHMESKSTDSGGE